MSREFADWFFDNKKAGCGNVWFMMMAAMWEGWQGRAAMLQGAGDEIGSWQNDKNTPASHAYHEHIRYESNAGGNLWVQCSKQKYERMKAAGMLTRVLYERPQNQQQNIPEHIPNLREAVKTIRNSGIAIDGEKILAERDDLNSPVIPDGYTKAAGTGIPIESDGWQLVPVEPTEEMIAAAMCSNDVLFDKEDDTLFRVQHSEIWRTMLAAAPLQEAKNG